MQRADVPFSARDTCTSCHDPVIWATTAKGNAMPVDPDPHPAGNLELTNEPWDHGTRLVVMARVVSGAPNTDRTDLHRAHFVTCPNADRHRRPR